MSPDLCLNSSGDGELATFLPHEKWNLASSSSPHRPQFHLLDNREQGCFPRPLGNTSEVWRQRPGSRLHVPNPNSLQRTLVSPCLPHHCLLSLGTTQAVMSGKYNYVSVALPTLHFIEGRRLPVYRGNAAGLLSTNLYNNPMTQELISHLSHR